MIAEVYADSRGRIIGFRRNAEDKRMHPPPADVAATVRFDATTNAAVLRGLGEHDGTYRVAGSPPRLQRHGQDVAINPPSAAAQDWQAIAQLQEDLTALDNPLTLAQLQPILKRCLLRQRHLLRQAREVN